MEREKAQARIAAYWEGQSGTYDEAPDHRLRGAADRAAWVALLKAVLPPPPAGILDVGTGTGFLAILLGELGHPVVGVDIAEGMLAVARQKAVGVRVPPVFLRGDAADLPLESGESAALVSRHLLWTLPDPLGALRDWYRVLRPGGRLVVIDGLWALGEEPRAANAPAPPPEPTYAAHYTPEVEAQLPLLGARTLDQVSAMIAEAGFVRAQSVSLAPFALAGWGGGTEDRPHPGRFVVTAERPAFMAGD
ncbi:MAG: class I SAM-dependent methyltransferase [Thermomicrobiales bacterium]